MVEVINPFKTMYPFSINTSRENRCRHWLIVECKEAAIPVFESLRIINALSSTSECQYWFDTSALTVSKSPAR